LDSDDSALIKLKGAQLHHDLKNQPGADADPNHADADVSQEAKEAVKKAMSDEDAESAIADALKDAVK